MCGCCSIGRRPVGLTRRSTVHVQNIFIFHFNFQGPLSFMCYNFRTAMRCAHQFYNYDYFSRVIYLYVSCSLSLKIRCLGLSHELLLSVNRAFYLCVVFIQCRGPRVCMIQIKRKLQILLRYKNTNNTKKKKLMIFGRFMYRITNN